MRVLGIIPARGGSKGVPGKNVRMLGGKPLLAYTAEAALGARSLARVILTTDDERIATVGRESGVDVPFLRPAELAADDTPTLPVARHAVRELEAAGDRYDAICLLQPTTPFRTADTIDRCIALLEESGADAVFTVSPIPDKYNPHWAYVAGADGSLRLSTGEAEPIPRRQSLPAAYHREGSVYVVRRDVLMDRGSMYGNVVRGLAVPAEQSVNIDTEADFARAEDFLRAREGDTMGPSSLGSASADRLTNSSAP